MLKLEGRSVRVLLLDTNFLTRLFERPERRAQRLLEKVDIGETIFAISVFTLLEVRDRPLAYQKLLKVLTWLPLIIIKSTHQLLEAEIQAYPDPTRVDPIMLAPVGVRGRPGQSREEVIRELFEHPTVLGTMDQLRSERSEILGGILGHRDNFPRPPGGYTAADARDFVEKICFQQAAFADLAWIERMGGAKFDLDPDAFPSVKAMAYSVFFRFYPDRERKPKRSDAFDIASASALPYVDQAALEKNQADILLKRLPGIDPFLADLTVWTFKDLTSD